MSLKPHNAIGSLAWFDLTAPNADELRDFYEQVVGWKSIPVNMGSYNDYSMALPEHTENVVAGVCHQQGVNAKIPPVWVLYIWVQDLTISLEKCTAFVGNIIDGPRKAGAFLFALVRDPAGATIGLMQQ